MIKDKRYNGPPPGPEEDHGEGGGRVDRREHEVGRGVGLHQLPVHPESNLIVNLRGRLEGFSRFCLFDMYFMYIYILENYVSCCFIMYIYNTVDAEN